MKTLIMLILIYFMANFEPLIGCSCEFITDATVRNVYMSAALSRTANVVIGKVVGYTVLPNSPFDCRNVEIRFEVERIIRGSIREKSILTFSELYGSCIAISSCGRFTFGNLSGGQYVPDTNRQILFLGVAPTFAINYGPCFQTSGRWSAEREKWIDSLNKVLVNTAVRGIEDEPSLPIFPNPCSEQTTLQYRLRQTSYVTIELVNMRGEVIQSVINLDVQPAGNHRQPLNVSNLTNGIYFCRVRSIDGIKMQRIIVSR